MSHGSIITEGFVVTLPRAMRRLDSKQFVSSFCSVSIDLLVLCVCAGDHTICFVILERSSYPVPVLCLRRVVILRVRRLARLAIVVVGMFVLNGPDAVGQLELLVNSEWDPILD